MQRPAARRLVGHACLLGLLGAASAPPSASWAIDARKEQAWAPALAAWGARAGAEAPMVGITTAPALTVVGQTATDSMGDAGGAGELRTREVPRDETQRWVPAVALHSGIIGQQTDASIHSDSAVTYNYTIRQTSGNSPLFFPAGTVLTVARSLTENKAHTIGIINSITSGRQPLFLANSLTWGLVPCGSVGDPTCLTKSQVKIGVEPALPASGTARFVTPFSSASFELMTPGLQETPGRPRLFARAGAGLAFSLTRDVAKEGIPGPVEYPSRLASSATEATVKGIGSKTSA